MLILHVIKHLPLLTLLLKQIAHLHPITFHLLDHIPQTDQIIPILIMVLQFEHK